MLTDLITNLDKIITEVETKVTPHNIRDGVEIFGVEGSLPELLTQHKNTVPKTYTQVIVPDEEYNALHEVIVEAVTHAIDGNITTGNIRYGKRILGVAGELSNLTQSEYDEMLLLEIQILGYTLYVYKNNLVLAGEDHTVSEGTLISSGTVDGKTLKLN